MKNKIVKINGKEIIVPKGDNIIEDFVKLGKLKKVGEEYFWTKRELISYGKQMKKLQRCLNNPLWRVYYKIFSL